MTIEELKAEVVELQKKVEELQEKAAAAYKAGMQASREFDSEMDGFLINFLRKPYSHIVIFAIAFGLLIVGAVIGATGGKLL